ncbi:3-mercaptopropionate dioxygenase [Candidatus Entotheonellaceae bacterium PAL068K]
MAVTVYTLSAFVQDLRAITAAVDDPQEIITRVSPRAQELALSKEWLQPRHYTCDPEQGFGVYLLHQEPDHTLAVFAISWLPGRGAPPHNHGTWAVVSGVDGLETNIFWQRQDDGSRPGYADVVWNGAKVFGAGEILAFLPHEIHSVTNDTDRVALSLHIYGMHLNHTGRSQFDVAQKREMPFLVKEG